MGMEKENSLVKNNDDDEKLEIPSQEVDLGDESSKGITLWFNLFNVIGQLKGELKHKADKSDIAELKEKIENMPGKLTFYLSLLPVWIGVIIIILALLTLIIRIDSSP